MSEEQRTRVPTAAPQQSGNTEASAFRPGSPGLVSQLLSPRPVLGSHTRRCHHTLCCAQKFRPHPACSRRVNRATWEGPHCCACGVLASKCHKSIRSKSQNRGLLELQLNFAPSQLVTRNPIPGEKTSAWPLVNYLEGGSVQFGGGGDASCPQRKAGSLPVSPEQRKLPWSQ